MKIKNRAPALALLLACLGGVPNADSHAWARPLDEVTASGELSVVVYRDYPPWSQNVDGRVVGVDADIAAALAKRLGLKLSLVELTADESVDDDLRNGIWKKSKLGQPMADVMLHVPYDRELDIRNDQVALVAPYAREMMAVARRAATPTVGLLNGLRIGVEVDSLADLYLSGAFGGRMRADTHRYRHLAEAAAALKTGELEALVGPRGEIEGALGPSHPGWVVSTPGFPGLQKTSWPFGMAVKDNSRDLGYALEDAVSAMTKDGELAAIFAAHAVSFNPP